MLKQYPNALFFNILNGRFCICILRLKWNHLVQLLILYIIFNNWSTWIFYTVVFQDLPSTKGQLISNCPFGAFKSTKKTNEIFVRISALASKKRSIQKNKGTLYHYLDDFILTVLHYFFDLTSFQRLEQKSLQKFRCFFGRFEGTKRTFWN